MTIMTLCVIVLKQKGKEKKDKPIQLYYDEDHSQLNTNSQALTLVSQAITSSDEKPHTPYAVYEEISDVIPQETLTTIEHTIPTIKDIDGLNVPETSGSENSAEGNATEDDEVVTELSCNIAYTTSQV